jgi:hypothetical protein
MYDGPELGGILVREQMTAVANYILEDIYDSTEWNNGVDVVSYMRYYFYSILLYFLRSYLSLCREIELRISHHNWIDHRTDPQHTTLNAFRHEYANSAEFMHSSTRWPGTHCARCKVQTL